MEKYPSELVSEPKPLVFLMGGVESEAPDFHIRLIRSLENTNNDVSEQKDALAIEFRTLTTDHDFPAKKTGKETLSLDGLLRQNWLLKHHEQLPSVVILVTTFSVDWTSTEWIRREASLYDKHSKLKNSLGARDARIVVVAVRVGSLLSADKDVMDERISSLKRHLQLDTRTFVAVSLAEVAPLTPTLRKLIKTIRDFSSGYYSAQIKRVKSIMKSSSVRGSYEPVINARYSFKIAFFYEFLGQPSQTLKYYKQCFNALLEAADAVDEDMIDQVKAVADFVNFKLCGLMLKNGTIAEASQQFKTHISCFSRVYCDMAWRHNDWISDQYVVYAQLLERHSVEDPLLETDRAFYYQNAMRFALKRQAAFARIRNATHGAWGGDGSDEMSAKYRGVIVVPPRYFGALPQLLDRVLDQVQQGQDEDAHKFLKQYLESTEKAVNHSQVVMNLINLTLSCVSGSGRRTADIQAIKAELLMSDGKFDQAFENFAPATNLMVEEGWISAVVPILRKKIMCSFYLGWLEEYLSDALTLYSIAHQNHLTKYDQEELHRDILSAITSSRPSAHQTSASSFISLPYRLDYGKCAVATKQPVHVLPNNYELDFSMSRQMFSMDVKYSAETIEIGQALRVELSVVSHFSGNLTFHEMAINFSDGIFKKFRHDGAGSGDSVGGVHEEVVGGAESIACLVFAAKKPTIFSFLVSISEDALKNVAASVQDLTVHLESLRLTMRIPADNIAFASPRSSLICESMDETDIINPDLVESSDDIYRFVYFNVSAMSSEFSKARRSSPSLSVKEVSEFVDQKFSPRFLRIVRPSAEVTMTSPSSVTLLQGPVQRIDVVFNVASNEVIDGRVYLSSDIVPKTAVSSLFWYPDKSNLQELDPQSHIQLDNVQFHPLRLDASMQSSSPILLPKRIGRSSFVVPLFLRSEVQNSFRIKLSLVYFPRLGLTFSSTKEFELKVQFVRPIHMSFSMISLKETPSGTVREGTISTVLKGDTINMAASLICVNSLTDSVEISGFSLKPLLEVEEEPIPIQQSNALEHGIPPAIAPSASEEGPPKSKPKKPTALKTSPKPVKRTCDYFLIKNATMIDAEIYNLLGKGESDEGGVLLCQGEVFVGSLDLFCLHAPADCRHRASSSSQSLESYSQFRTVNFSRASSDNLHEGVPVSLGSIYVDWRLHNTDILKPPTLANQSYQSSSDDKFQWLHPLAEPQSEDREDAPSMGALDSEIASTRVCGMVFNVPHVQVVDPPFDVVLTSPSTCVLGKPMAVNIHVRNKLWSLERLGIRAGLHENLLIAGNTSSIVEVGPKQSVDISLSFIPLKCGHIGLPQVMVTWERNSSSIIDLGLQSSARYTFVKPV